MLSDKTIEIIQDYKKSEQEIIILQQQSNTNEGKEIIRQKQFALKTLRSNLQETIMTEVFGTNAKGIYFRTFNGNLITDLKDVEITKQLGFGGGYNHQIINYLSSVILPADNIYVIGAHIGSLVLPIAKKCRKVYAFEPNPETFELLSLNVMANDLTNVIIFNQGTYNHFTKLQFLASTVNSGGAKILPKSNSFLYNYDNPKVIEIDVVCLDSFISEKKLPLPDILVIDTEGSEFATLQCSKAALQNCRVMIIEFISHHLKNVSNVSIDDFMNEFLHYFRTLQIVGSKRVFKGEEIKAILYDIYKKGIDCDLIFGKL